MQYWYYLTIKLSARDFYDSEARINYHRVEIESESIIVLLKYFTNNLKT